MPEEDQKKGELEESIEELLKEYESDQKKSKWMKLPLNILPWIVLLMGIFAVIMQLYGGGKFYVSKSDIKNQIISAIENDGNLIVIKNIFENRNKVRRTLQQIFDDTTNYYGDAIPLSKVLEDIRSDIYTTKVDKKGILDRLNKIINEHQERNPFDALEPSQKDYFENIRIKAGPKYIDIRNEVDKLATELESKNSLVTKYLRQSTTSFWLSILALIFALAIGLYQIFQNRSSRLRLLIASALAQPATRVQRTRD